MSFAAAAMTMRASIRRNAGGRDVYGGRTAPTTWGIIAEAVPCFVWVAQKRETEDGQKVVVVEDVRGVFRFEADVQRGDQLYELKDRRGRVVLDGILEVDAVTERTLGASQSHKEVSMRRHRG